MSADAYSALIYDWLQRFRDYPREARLHHIEGDVMLRLRVEASGTVTSVAIEHGSGFNVLDQAVMTMAAKARPLPPWPGHVARQELDVLVPIRFRLER